MHDVIAVLAYVVVNKVVVLHLLQDSEIIYVSEEYTFGNIQKCSKEHVALLLGVMDEVVVIVMRQRNRNIVIKAHHF